MSTPASGAPSLRLWADPRALREGHPGWVEASGTTPIEIGRDASCDLHLLDPTVQRRHARAWRDASGALWIEDLASTNGTFRNGERVHGEAARLAHGDELMLGRVRAIADDARRGLPPSPAPSSDGAKGLVTVLLTHRAADDADRLLAVRLVQLRREAAPEAVEHLIAMLAGPEPLRFQAARALGAAGAAATAGVPALLGLLQHADEALRARAGESLGEIAAADTTWVSRVKPALERALAAETAPAPRFGIAEGLSKIGRAIAPQLGKLVKDPHRWGLRMASGEARTFRIGEDGDPTRDEPPPAALTDEPSGR